MVQQSEPQIPAVPSVQPQEDLARALTDMIMGFQVSQMIYVAVKLGIPDLLKEGPRGADDLARETGAHAPSLYRLLRGLASLGIFAEDEQNCFVLTPLAQLLRDDVPRSQHARALQYGSVPTWTCWSDLLHSVRTGENAWSHLFGISAWKYREQNPEANEIFNRFMTTNTASQTAALISSYDFSGIHTLVDVGGGQGVFIAAILEANPDMHGIVCDAPHVVAGAQTLLEQAGVLDRCELVPCDFFVSVPEGGDAYLLKFILHDWADEDALTILKNCRRAMGDHGRLLLVDRIIKPGNGPDWGKLLDVQMLVELGGRERTEAETRALMAEAGFELTHCVQMQTGTSLYIIEGKPV